MTNARGCDNCVILDWHYTAQEKMQIIEAAEKNNIYLYIKVLANPRRIVTRAKYLSVTSLIVLNALPKTPQEGTYYLIKKPSWKLFFANKIEENISLKEIQFDYRLPLKEAIMKLPRNKSPQNYLDSDLIDVKRALSEMPSQSYQDISGVTDFFQRLTSAEVTALRSYAPARIPIIDSEPHFHASIYDCWVDKFEANALIATSKSSEIRTAKEMQAQLDILLSRHFSEIGKNGGRPRKTVAHGLELALNEITNMKRGHTKFIRMMQKSFSNDDDHYTEGYKGTENCSSIFIKGDTLHYVYKENGKPMDGKISVHTLRTRFKEANSLLKNTHSQENMANK